MEPAWITQLMLFAAEAPAGGNGGGFQWVTMLTLWLPIIFLFYFLLILPQKRERARREAQMRELKPNDRVVTIGGIYGVVTRVDRDNDTLILKVDESNNTKIRVTLSAVARVVGDEASKETASKKE